MRITKVKLFNYSSYYDREAAEFDLGPGFNFVVGQNNAGKTKLLDMLTLDVRGKRTNNLHRRDYANIPMTEADLGLSRYNIELQFERNEIAKLVLSESDILYVPARIDQTSDEVKPATVEMMRLVQNPQRLRFRIFHDIPDFVEVADTEYNILFHVYPLTFSCLAFEHSSCTSELVLCEANSWQLVSDHETCWHVLYNQALRNRIGRIDSYFRIPPQSNSNSVTLLKSDASNLVNALKTLKCNQPELFREYLARLRQVIPSIGDLAFEYDSEQVMLKVLEYTSGILDSESGIPLADCGTGVGRVLAIIYQVVTMPCPSVMLIDEPQAYLHAGALRRLLNVLEEYDHQYIIATHSPTAIMSVEEKTILLVKRENMISTVKSIAVDDNSQLEGALTELGTRRSDIFGMDAVVWVEGKTDEKCFKLIMDSAHRGLGYGNNILGLVNTDDLINDDYAPLAAQIYERLSGGVGLLPSVLCFLFDGDKKPRENKYPKELRERDKVKFLRRQNYESYLIVPEILADILNRDSAEDKEKNNTEDSVKQWIFEKEGKDYNDSEWLETVNGKMFLVTLFNDMAGISYRDYEVDYGVEITKRILERDGSADHFKEIVDILEPLLHPNQQPADSPQT